MDFDTIDQLKSEPDSLRPLPAAAVKNLEKSIEPNGPITTRMRSKETRCVSILKSSIIPKLLIMFKVS
ncbi:hypothetical protein DFP94_103257 [Fontibacillus phaseoli]|uniref:Uncharacterized protein n=1 Tax=Fontibacillus phaseoli TaxID=1416533 RepID=A0A369BIX2_9BACL|nr:hypothetical protein [Fontibacillus phaseoli]RCX20526.1 hypothetical protein DFP94_103257 [Fontibacillus phaseoli]